MQAYIDEKQEQADAIVCTNPGALEEYRRREARIAELTEQQAAAADKLELCRQIIAQKKVGSACTVCVSRASIWPPSFGQTGWLSPGEHLWS